MPLSFYSASVVLFQLHGIVVRHKPVLAIPSSTVHILKTWILITETILVLAACSWGRDVALFGQQVDENSSLVSVLFREAFSYPYISYFHFLVNSFSFTCLSPYFYLNDKYWYCCLYYNSSLPQRLHNT